MKKIKTEERKQIQLDLMQSIHDFCIKNNIKYTLAYGSLLGAIRHKGFIPWDDDIDIAMLRGDYDKFVMSYSDNKHPYMKVHEIRVDSNYDYPFAKVSDERTIYFEKTNCSKVGVFVDVFPVDNLYNNYNDSVHYLNTIHKKYKLLRNIKYLKWSKNRSFIKNIFIYLFKPLVLPFSIRFFSEKLEKEAQSRKSLNTNYVGLVCGNYKNLQSIVKKTMYEDIIELQFENHIFMGVKRFHEYLTNEYGDYMTPPHKKSNHCIEEYSYWK